MQGNDDNVLKAEEYYNSLTDEEKIKISNIVSYIKGQNHQLNDKEISEIFKKLDVNGNNSISFTELQNFLAVLRSKVNNYYINEIMKEYDQNASGEISKEVFIEKMKDSLKGKYKKDDITELKEVFQLFDVNHDNKISYEDINSVMTALGETTFTDKMCKDMIKHLKRKKSGLNANKNKNIGNNEDDFDDESEENFDSNLYLTYDEFVDIVKDESEL